MRRGARASEALCILDNDVEVTEFYRNCNASAEENRAYLTIRNWSRRRLPALQACFARSRTYLAIEFLVFKKKVHLLFVF